MTRIEDSVGEEKTLASVRTRSRALGLDPQVCRYLLRAQIEATKSIQASRHRAWALDAKTAPAAERRTWRDRCRVSGFVAGRVTLKTANSRAARRAADPARPAGRRLLDARAADLIQVGGADLLASQIALEPLYAIAR